MGQGIDFAGKGSEDTSGRMPSSPGYASRQKDGPIVMAGDGDKDTNGTIANPTMGGPAPAGGGIDFVGNI